MSISVALRHALGRVDTGEPRRRRIVGIIQGTISGLGNRLLGTAVNLLAVPLTIGYLGPERYGVWVLIGSLLAWGRLADLGLGNGLTNSIAAAVGADRQDLVRSHISTAFAILSAVAAILGISVAIAWRWIDWNSLLGVTGAAARQESGPAIATAIAIFLLGFPLSQVSRIYTALQDGKLSNYWAAAGRLVGLAVLLVVCHTHGGLVWLILTLYGTGLLMGALSGVWLFVRHKPALAPGIAHVRRESARQLANIGVQFFLIQVLALIVFETDSLMIAHYLGAKDVAPYSLTYSLFGFTSIIQNVLFGYVWVGYSDAIARRDIAWVRRAFLTNLTFSFGCTCVAVVPLIFIARPFIALWAGEAVVPQQNLVLWMAGWAMINAFCSPIACLLAAASHLKAQIIYSAASAGVNIALSLYLVRHWGITGAIAGTVIAYLCLICLPASIDVALLLKRLSRNVAHAV